VVLLMN
jgi:hypothetical protein